MGRCLRWCLNQHLEIVEAWMIGKARLEHLMELQVNHIYWRQDESMERSGRKFDLWMCSHLEVESSGLRCCGGKDWLVKYYTVALVLITFENHQDLAWPPFLERMQLLYRIRNLAEQFRWDDYIGEKISQVSAEPCATCEYYFNLKALKVRVKFKIHSLVLMAQLHTYWWTNHQHETCSECAQYKAIG